MKKLIVLAVAVFTGLAAWSQNQSKILLTTDNGVEEHKLSEFWNVEFDKEKNLLQFNTGSNVTDPIVYDDKVRKVEFDIERPLNTTVCKSMADVFNYDWGFGYGAIMHVRDVLTGDMAFPSSSYDWFATWADAGTRIGKSYIYAYGVYNFFYREAIPSINNLITDLSVADCPEAYKADLGAAYAFRALLYLDLARMYEYLPNEKQSPVNEWGHDVSGLTVPIITEDISVEDYNTLTRATRDEITSFILSDLAKAEQLLPQESDADKRYPHLDCIYGLKARLYMWRGDYAQARSFARKAINASSVGPMTQDDWLSTTKGFNTRNCWMWGIYDYRASDTGWTSWLSSEANFGYVRVGGLYPMIGAALYQRIAADDFRRNVFKPASGGNVPYLDAVTAKSFPTYTSVKFRPGEGNVDDSSVGALVDYPLMRVEEMYFIEAEAAAHQSESEGVSLLTDFMKKYRAPNYAYDGTHTIIDEIIFQKRIELWGEGQSYFDIKRLDMPVERDYEGTNFTHGVVNTTRRPYWMNFILPSYVENYQNLKEWNNPEFDLDEARAGVNPTFTLNDIYNGKTIPLDSIEYLFFSCDNTNADNNHISLGMQFSLQSNFAKSFTLPIYTYYKNYSVTNKQYCYNLNDSVLTLLSEASLGKTFKLYMRGVGLLNNGPVVSTSNVVAIDAVTHGPKSPAYVYVDEGGYANNDDYRDNVFRSEGNRGRRVYTTNSEDRGRLVPTVWFGVLPASLVSPTISLATEDQSIAVVNCSALQSASRSSLLRIGDVSIPINAQGEVQKYNLCSLLKTHFTKADLQKGLTVQLIIPVETDAMTYFATTKSFTLRFTDYDAIMEGGEFSFSKDNEKGAPAKLTIYRLNRIYVGETDTYYTSETFTCHLSCDNPHVTVPETVTMRNGELQSDIGITYDDAFFTNEETATITIDAADAFQAALTQWIVSGESEWKELGTCTFKDNLLEVTSYAKIQRSIYHPNMFRIIQPYRSLSGGGGEDLVLTIMQPGETYGRVTATQNDLVYFDNCLTGFIFDAYDAEFQLRHPFSFTEFDESDAQNSKVLSYQANGLPKEIQLAPLYYMADIGYYDYTQYTDVITITFP